MNSWRRVAERQAWMDGFQSVVYLIIMVRDITACVGDTACLVSVEAVFIEETLIVKAFLELVHAYIQMFHG